MSSGSHRRASTTEKSMSSEYRYRRRSCTKKRDTCMSPFLSFCSRSSIGMVCTRGFPHRSFVTRFTLGDRARHAHSGHATRPTNLTLYRSNVSPLFISLPLSLSLVESLIGSLGLLSIYQATHPLCRVCSCTV